MSFSDFLLEELHKRDWVQADLARKSGLTPQAISRYIKQERSNPDPDALARIAKALDLPIEAVYKAAGIPTSTISEREAKLLELDHIFAHATEEQREEIIRFSRFITKDNPTVLSAPSAARLNPKTQPR